MKTALIIFCVVGLSVGQEEIVNANGGVRRLRLRRPRPVPAISDPDGIAEGRPIPLRRIPQGVPVDQLVSERQNTADLLAAALAVDDEDLGFDQGQSLQSTDALQSLLATAAEVSPQPFIPEYEDVVEEQAPLAQIPRRQQRPQQVQQAEVPRSRVPSGRTRRPPGVPRRVRPRHDNEKKGERQPNRDREPAGNDNVGTVERYSHTNDDGSFTFGYISEDGSFREETRGVDCITRGKYGYIDPDGKKREFTYVSGLPCNITDEESEENVQQEDPINPNDRFRTSAAVQLSADEIPNSARPRQRNPQVQRPAPVPAPRAQPQPRPSADLRPQQQFSSFQQQPQQPQRAPATRLRDPALLNRAPVQPAQAGQGGALQNLFNIIGDQQPTPLPAQRPRQPSPTLRPIQQSPTLRPIQQSPAPAVTRPRIQPQTPRPSPSVFDFDSELDSFTLNKPAISFDKSAPPPAQEDAPKPNFSTELVFDPASGTFKTELRQALPGGEEVRISNDAAPSGASPRPAAPTPAPTPSALPPTVGQFTAFSPTTLRPTTPRPQSPRPSPTPTPRPSPRPTQPSLPSPSSPFTPLTFPSPAPTSPRPATAVPERPRAAQPASPRPTLAASPRPTTLAATPRPTTFAATPSPRPVPRQQVLVASPSPSPSPRPTIASQGSPTPAPSGSFFFQPFPTIGSPRPITATSPAPGQPRPAVGQPGRFPANAGNSAGFPAGTFPITNQPQSRPPPGFGGQFLGQPTRPPPGFPQNQPQFIQTNRPTAAAPRPSPSLATARPPQQPTQARPIPFSVFNNNNFNRPQPQPAQFLGATPRPAGVPEQPRAIQGAPAASPSPAPGTPRPATASPRPTPIQFSASPTPLQLSPRPVTPTPSAAARPVTPQVQFGFQPITQTVTPQPSQRPAQPPQRPPPGFVQVQRPQGPPPRPAGQPPRPAPQRPANAPFTAFASGNPPQLSQFVQQPGQPQGRPQQFIQQPGQPQGRPQQFIQQPGQPQGRPQQFVQQQRPGFFGQPQAPRPQQLAGRPQQLGIPPQLASQQQPGGRFQPFGRPPPQQPGQPQGRPPQRPASSPFAVFNPNLLRGARFF